MLNIYFSVQNICSLSNSLSILTNYALFYVLCLKIRILSCPFSKTILKFEKQNKFLDRFATNSLFIQFFHLILEIIMSSMNTFQTIKICKIKKKDFHTGLCFKLSFYTFHSFKLITKIVSETITIYAFLG